MTHSADGFGLVVNPNAGRVHRRYLARRPFWGDLLPEDRVRVTRDSGDLAAAIAEFRAAGVGVIGCLGGDGTVHRLVEAVIAEYGAAGAPVLAPLAGGTMNGLPRALGCGGPPERRLADCVEASARAVIPARPHPMLRVTDHRSERQRYGFTFGAGLIYRMDEDYYRRARPGVAAAVWDSSLPVRRALLGRAFAPDLGMDLRVEDETWLAERPHSVAAAVVENPFLWFRPFGSEPRKPETFRLSANAMSPREMAPRLWRIYRGRCRHERLRIGQVRAASMRGTTGYVLDGDPYPGPLDVDLEPGPSLRFIDFEPPVALRRPRHDR